MLEMVFLLWVLKSYLALPRMKALQASELRSLGHLKNVEYAFITKLYFKEANSTPCTEEKH